MAFYSSKDGIPLERTADVIWKEQLNKIFNDLRHKNEDVRVKASKQLAEYVSTQVREVSGESFSRLVNDLNTRISNYVNSNVFTERVGAVLAIDELIHVDYDENENANKIAKFGNYLRVALTTADISILPIAARALGKLVRTGGAVTEFSETVDTEMKRALEWLSQAERYEPRRYAAVLVLRELAINAPTLFNVHVALFVDVIWVGLADPSLTIREAAVEALRACLDVIADREHSLTSQWYKKLMSEAQKGFKQPKDSSPAVHASLLVIGELLVNTGDFMSDYFKETCEVCLKYAKESKNPLVRKAVIGLLPRFAAFNPRDFVTNYLNTSAQFLLGIVKKVGDPDRPKGFIALGEVAIAVGPNIKQYLEAIVGAVKMGLQAKKKTEFCAESLTCIGMLSKASGAALRSYMDDLLCEMFNGGLTPTLTSSLKVLGENIPILMPDVQELLLNFLAVILGHKPFSDPGTTTSRVKRTVSISSNSFLELKSPQQEELETVGLALTTLGSFDFTTNTNVKNFDLFLEELVKDCVIKYLDNDDNYLRKQAALTCASLFGSASKRTPAAMAEVLEKLLIVGITDRDASIRQEVLASLDVSFDNFLAQPENLRSLFLALNDEVFEVRELAITVIGRLTIRNPAYVMPSLRKTLLQLLGDLQYGGDRNKKEESARLLSHLISASHRLIKPYVPTIAQVLLPNLKEDSTHVSSYILSALGELASAGGEEMRQNLHILLPLIINTLQDQSSAAKREAALKTLGKLASYTGYVIQPYLDYPQLLGILLDLVKTESSKSIRHEVLKALGILGALDPYKYNELLMRLKGADEEEATGRKEKNMQTFSAITSVPLSSQEAYYPTVAVTALVRIMRDPSLSTHYRTVVESLMPVMKNLGLKSSQFLPLIMPPFLQIMRNSEPKLREWLFQELSVLVSIVKHNIRDYLDDVFKVIRENWSTPLLGQIIALVEDTSKELKEEFKVFLPGLIPPMLRVLHTDMSQKRQATRKVLHALEIFGSTLEDYLHLVVPAIVNLFEQDDAEMEIPRLAIQTLGRLCKFLNFSDYASRIIHPLIRLLDTPQDKDKSSTIVDSLRSEALQTLCSLVYQLESDYAIFIPMVNKVLTKQNISDARYETLISRLMKNQPLQENDTEGPIDSFSRRNSIAQLDDNTPSTVPLISAMPTRLKVNHAHLKKHWEAEQRSTKEDWGEWIRRFSVGLLRESPSPALRSCLTLAQDYYPLVRELFNAGFISIWTELDEATQSDLVNNLEKALTSPNIPPEILQTLLNLAEFMEHEEKRLPISIKKLGTLAEACRAYAKALYYKEEEFEEAPDKTIEALISLNNQLGQRKAAEGILKFAEEKHGVKLKEEWYEKLYHWEDALKSYRRAQAKLKTTDIELSLGQIRCLRALADWRELEKLAEETWDKIVDDNIKSQFAVYGASAAWNLSNWTSLEKFVAAMNQDNERSFYQAVLAVHQDQCSKAQKYIEQCRRMIDTELLALIGESYNRAYPVVLRVQLFSELEEAISYKLASDYPERQATIKKIWKERLTGCQGDVETWQQMLLIRSLVLPPEDDEETWLKFASLCRKSNRMNLALNTLISMLGVDPATSTKQLPVERARVSFAYIKHIWASGKKDSKTEAFNLLQSFTPAITNDNVLRSRLYQKLGQWQMELQTSLDENVVPQILSYLMSTTNLDPNWYKGWHSWALANFEVISHFEKTNQANNTPKSNKKIIPHLSSAIKGFFRSISLSPAQSLQDTLRLLTLWFKYGNLPEVEGALLEGFNTVRIDTWLQVIPQLIARIAAPVTSVRTMIQELLVNVGKEHPQALVFPLNVALKSQSSTRIAAAHSVMEQMRKHSHVLVEQALMVAQELVRVAILWNEMWFEGLEDASKLHFTEHNPEEAILRLKPLHDMLEETGPISLVEASFKQAHGRDLQEALDWIKSYQRSGHSSDLSQAWDLYHTVYKSTKQAVQSLTGIDLEYTSTKLLHARELELAIPGTYRSNQPIIRINSFVPHLEVIPSKQHPRKLTVIGSDGFEYAFLLKGHEDLRQDERVMQLFGLINTLLVSDFQTARNNLTIQRYSVIPLAPNSGLLGWVPNCDTMHNLVRAYRDARKIPVTHEHRLLLQMSADFANLCGIQKVEIFKSVLDSTDGMDLKKILWLQSETAETWLERRTNYTRSLAVMSMVGYILGLGDRHCSNIMIQRQTGKIVHIDFGDCFEVAMHRDKFPERIPFRLTRMLVNAMGVSGAEGNFRSTCENVMNVLRYNRESLMAVLEAFVYDPLISWRLITPNKNDPSAKGATHKGINMEEEPDTPNAVTKERVNLEKEVMENEIPEVTNERAITITDRILNKLTGKDFSPKDTLNVEQQVDRLIQQATDIENLSQCYLGWSPYW